MKLFDCQRNCGEMFWGFIICRASFEEITFISSLKLAASDSRRLEAV